jgi:SAM-dependent methyltransferase
LRQSQLYDADSHVGELYEKLEHDNGDIKQITKWVTHKEMLRILEPFCGTGRIMFPLIDRGFHVTGIDASVCMVSYARSKVLNLAIDTAPNVKLIVAEVLDYGWPSNMDLVILGGNCMYELPTESDQLQCIQKANQSLRQGGYLYLDNDHMEGELSDSWKDPSPRTCFPSGECADGTVVRSTMRTVWFDSSRRLVRFERKTTATSSDGKVTESVCIQQKHPPSIAEMESWIGNCGFQILSSVGDRSVNPLLLSSPRATYWAKKK